MRALLAGLCLLGAGCGGECIPKSAVAAASFPIRGAAAQTLAVARSADELRAAIAKVRIEPPPEQQQLDAFIGATSFSTFDVALVPAGGARAQLAGLKADGPRVTLYFTGTCSPCGGGNPGSYEQALATERAARTERVELVRVPKHACVEVRACEVSCGHCPGNVP